MAVNDDLIRRTVKAMEENKDRWDQRNWVAPWTDAEEEVSICNTTMCFAGFALAEHMGVEAFLATALERSSFSGCWVPTNWVLDEIEGLRAKAQAVLGLDDIQAIDLFGSMDDDLDQYKELITKVTGVTFP